MNMTATKQKTDPMLYSSFSEIDRIIKGFEQGTLPKEEWTHQAHLTVACWYLICYQEAEAVARIRQGIIKYNNSVGTANTETSGYHETITLFWMQALRKQLSGMSREYPLIRLLSDAVGGLSDKALPFAYYSRELLMSCEARFTYVEPDLRGFD